jgi:hypothetical protein
MSVTKAIQTRAEGSQGQATVGRMARSGGPRGRCCPRGAEARARGSGRRHVRASGAAAGWRACARGARGGCPRRGPRACCRAGAGVSHGGARLAFITAARLAGAAAPTRPPRRAALCCAPPAEQPGLRAPNRPNSRRVPRAPWGARAAFRCCSCCCCHRCCSRPPPGTPRSSPG